MPLFRNIWPLRTAVAAMRQPPRFIDNKEFYSMPELARRRPPAEYNLRAEVSPITRCSNDAPELADRFELFIGGHEIANGFSELNDADDQRRRFEGQAKERSRGDEEAMPFGEDCVTALECCPAPTAGEGIGIEHLAMPFTGGNPKCDPKKQSGPLRITPPSRESAGRNSACRGEYTRRGGRAPEDDGPTPHFRLESDGVAARSLFGEVIQWAVSPNKNDEGDDVFRQYDHRGV